MLDTQNLKCDATQEGALIEDEGEEDEAHGVARRSFVSFCW